MIEIDGYLVHQVAISVSDDATRHRDNRVEVSPFSAFTRQLLLRRTKREDVCRKASMVLVSA